MFDLGQWPHRGCEKRRESKNDTKQLGGVPGKQPEGSLPGTAWAQGAGVLLCLSQAESGRGVRPVGLKDNRPHSQAGCP